MFDLAGNPAGAAFSLISGNHGSRPLVTALGQGGFLVSLTDRPQRYIQAFDNDAVAVGQPLITSRVGDVFQEALLGLADGSVFDAISANADAQANDDIFVYKLRLPFTLTGGPGNDIHIVGNPGDVVIEGPGQGYDVIYSSVSYTLAGDQEIEGLLTITWELTEAIDLTGNGLGQLPDRQCRPEPDRRRRRRRRDDRAEGNDNYVVDSLGDQVFEAAGGGYDVIYSWISWTLAGDQEIEGLSTMSWEATDAINLTGNGLNNYLIGNAGANTLDGRSGADVMYGREGDDIDLADSAGDQVFEFADGGHDVIYSAASYTPSGRTSKVCPPSPGRRPTRST